MRWLAPAVSLAAVVALARDPRRLPDLSLRDRRLPQKMLHTDTEPEAH